MTSHSDIHKAGAFRVLARDDLLQAAHDAENAIGLVRQSDRLGHATFTEPELFDLALRQQLKGANESDTWAARAQYLAYAGAIVQFCELVSIRIPAEDHSVELYGRALDELAAINPRSRSVTPNHEDLTLGVITTYHAIRNLRLAGKPRDALLLAWQPDEYFYGSGAEPHRGHFEFEISACKLALSQSSQTAAALRESEGYWAYTEAAAWPTRNRYEFALALTAFAEGDADSTDRHLQVALSHLRATRGTEIQHDIQELSLTLAVAEHLTTGDMTEVTSQRAFDLISRAVSLVEHIRGRWRVVARSRSPLSIVFQRIYGDIALLVSRLPGPEAGRLGLRVLMSAKQTGFASLMRANRSLMNEHVSVLVDEIVMYENRLETTNVISDEEWERLHLNLSRARAELEDTVSPLLADFVLPGPADVAAVTALIGTRNVLDYIALPETATRDTNWFRALIRSDGSIEFDRLQSDAAFQKLFHGHDGDPTLTGRRAAQTVDWFGLAKTLLPSPLLTKLAATPANKPIDLLISPHSDLCFVPWPALEIDSSGTRLVERAVITQTPALTCLSHADVPPTGGPALVRLVAQPHGAQRDSQPRGVNVEREREAWGLRASADGEVPLSRCDLQLHRNAVDVPGSLLSALDDPHSAYGFVHVAAHGTGTGLAQEITLPERLTAGHALGLRWPTSILLAVCHVGKVDNIREAEPFGFPIVLLAGGARCVVAGIHAISDEETGMIAAAMVNSLRRGTRLDVALRDAQCTFLSEDVYRWALLSAFVR
ncbi:MAG: CHAT domain-containing protein [Pseudonocardiaceae bacterium]